ncbi:TPA: hypothetical protein ACW72Z_004381, partial [Aeromonas veronii]
QNRESRKCDPEVNPSGSGKSGIPKNRKRSRGRPEAALGKMGNPQKSHPPRSPPALSVQLKEKRDAAILEKHKEGMSNRAIAKLFNIGQDTDNGHKTVGKALKDIFEALGKNPNLGKLPTPEVSNSAIPMASTEDRSDTREDASS